MSIFSRKDPFPNLAAISKELVDVLKKPPTTLEDAIASGDAVLLNVPPKPPEPDLSTKPKDIVGYCFGFACPKKHVQGFFDSITLERYSERRPCSTCGGVAKPCVVKKVAEARWRNIAADGDFWSSGHKAPESLWDWSQSYGGYIFGKKYWTCYSFFHYLESPKRGKK